MKNDHSSRCFTELRLLNSVAEQRRKADASRGEVEEGYILVRFELYTEIGSLRRSGFPMMWEEETLVDEEEFLFHLPSLKKLESYRSKCSGIILESLSSMGVPIEERPSAIENVFKAVDLAVSPELPIHVTVRDRTYHIGRVIGGLKKFEAEAADTSSSSCPICLEDFPATLLVNQPITRLPCGHRYHTYCAIPWLEANPRCPVCRYAMPYIN